MTLGLRLVPVLPHNLLKSHIQPQHLAFRKENDVNFYCHAACVTLYQENLALVDTLERT